MAYGERRLLKGISLANFKGIQLSKIDGFNQVNVFIGEFGSGKSTILDALCLLRLSTDRNECLRRVLNRRTRRDPDLRNCWYRYAGEGPIGIRYEFESSSYHVQFVHKPENPTRVAVNTATDGDGTTGEIPWTLDSSYGEFRAPKEEVFARGITLIDDLAFTNISVFEEKTLTPIRERRLDPALVDLLRKSFETVHEFEFLAASPRRPREFRCSLTFDDARVQIDDVSDGVRNGLVILSTAFTLKDTALLLEEPENHMYPKALNALLESLVHLCKDNKLQLFVTTHRPEVLASLVEHGKELVAIFHFSRQNGEVRARPSRWNDTRILADVGWDIEKLVKGYEKYVVVEGRKDKLIVEQTFKKIKGVLPENLWITVIGARGVDRNLREIVKALLPTEREIFVLPDLDKKSSDERRVQLVDSIKTLASEGYQVAEEEYVLTLSIGTTKASLRKKNIMPLGDPDGLGSLGFRFESFSMDDYLLEMIINNPNMWSELEIAEENVPRIKRSKSSKSAISGLTILTDEKIEGLFQACAVHHGLAKVIEAIASET